MLVLVRLTLPLLLLCQKSEKVVIDASYQDADSLPVPVSEIIVDVFYYFQKSSTRKHRLAQFQELHDVEQEKMLKHICTRWLSIDSLLKNWDAPKAFFKEEHKAATLERVNHVFLKSPTNRLYCIFLHYSNQLFNEVLLSLQSSEPKVHLLRGSLDKLLLDIFVRFVKHVHSQLRSLDKLLLDIFVRFVPHCEPVYMDTPRAKVSITSTATSASSLDDFAIDEPEWRMYRETIKSV